MKRSDDHGCLYGCCERLAAIEERGLSCVVGGCEVGPIAKVKRCYYKGWEDGSYLDLCFYHRDRFMEWEPRDD